MAKWLVKNKLWEELISYFPLIRNEPHGKRRVQQFSIVARIFVATGTCLPSRCLAYGDTYIYMHRQQGDIISLLLFLAAFTYFEIMLLPVCVCVCVSPY
jgi:hypothetical protein